MALWMNKGKSRRKQVREQRAKASGTLRKRLSVQLLSWPTLTSVLFLTAVSVIALVGEMVLGYSIGQKIDHPIYARVGFQVRDVHQTEVDREAARAATPSYYSLNARALIFDRIKADLMRVYQAAMDAEVFEEYSRTLGERNWPAVEDAYNRLRTLADETGRAQFLQCQIWRCLNIRPRQ